ncbi:hypothetical protein CDD83_7171 [Cordyceps sp. RAO-2017]|nr:hypothetical protein CDD83_7171 [Cordyceps sp. RAO-2017]
MALPQATPPVIKTEASSAEPFSIPTPSDNHLSALFTPASPDEPTVNPMAVMSPKPGADENQPPSRLSSVPDMSPAPTEEMPSSTDKKPTKKRKSWGQVLPEPKTNLPPRKRAKTEDEKEQRRVERVLRNRRAAQSSRERKRLEVEALERRNQELEALLVSTRNTNLMLLEELNRFRRESGVVTRSPSPLNSLRDNPITLSQQLFGSQDGARLVSEHSTDLVGELMMSSALSTTVNPASLSPELAPVSDQAKACNPSTEPQPSQQLTRAASPDLTQHPAEMLYDLQSAADADRYLLESSLLSSPNSSTLDDDYMAGDSAACLHDQSVYELFNLDEFLNDDANPAVSDFVAAGDDAAADHGLEPQVPDSEIQVS